MARRGRGLAALLLCLLAPAAADATDSEDGKQAGAGARGERVFAQHCARCHGEQGEGLIGPAVIGDEARLSNYRTGRGLYDYVESTMPQDKPGSLTEAQYRAVVTYLLRRNHYTSSCESLTKEALVDISLQDEESE